MWLCKVLNSKSSDKVRNKKTVRSMRKEIRLLGIIKTRKSTLVGYMLRREYLIRDMSEPRVERQASPGRINNNNRKI